VGHAVRCVNTGSQIQIFYEGKLLGQFGLIPGTEKMLRLNPEAAQVSTRPLSDLSREWWEGTADRQMEIYQEIVGA